LDNISIFGDTIHLLAGMTQQHMKVIQVLCILFLEFMSWATSAVQKAESTVTVTTTYTTSIVAVNGLIQNLSINIANGNGHLWEYTSEVVSAVQILTIVPTTVTSCPMVTVFVTTTTTLGQKNDNVPQLLDPEEIKAKLRVLRGES
jgi:hypothetical protein